MKTYKFEEHVTIAAPRELVWAVAQDEGRRRIWDTRLERMTRITRGSMGPGALVDVTVRLFGRRFRSRLQYLAWAPPFRSGARSLIERRDEDRLSVEWRFDETCDGSTVWTYSATIRREDGPLAGLHLALYGGRFRARTRRSMERLRDLVQSEYRLRPPLRDSERPIQIARHV